MAKKKNIKVQDVSIEDMDYIDYKMNPDSDKWKSYEPNKFVSYDYNIKLKCKTETQKQFLNLLKDDSKVITAALGSPGSGKSYVSLSYALQALKSGKYKRIICFVPTAPAGASALQIGYLKGTLEDKIQPFYQADKETLTKILEQSGNCQSEKIVDGLLRNNVLQYRLLNFVRGQSIDDSLMLLNEVENYNIQELILIMTRIGYNSKLCLTGDVLQCDRSDIKKSGKGNSGIEQVVSKLEDMEEFGMVTFSKEDIVRNPIISKILDRLIPES